ncbi:MAG: hypothetical protein HKP30_14510 [Myxococcales bacterium]|nr:hypothetical protein [Myxococcales bacterium]
MLIRRFEAPSTAEALAAVKAAFGPDAVILGTRNKSSRRAPFGLLGKPIVEVTAAIDREPRPDPERSSGRSAADSSWRTLQVSRALVAPLEDELRALRELIERSSSQPTAPPPSLAEEVAELRRVARALAARVPEARADDPESSYRAAGLSLPICQELGVDARARMLQGETRGEALVGALAERLEPKLTVPRDEGRHRLVIGAAGAGKTTTLAKQAARIQDDRTRVVSTDAHRYGGTEALRGLSRHLGMKIDLANEPEAVGRFARKRRCRVLVDTPGRPRSDRDALFDLLQLSDSLGPETEVQLVVSAKTKESDLREDLSHFGCLRPSSLVVSCVDESVELGNVVNLLLEEGTPPLSWIGTGQRVPDDLRPPDPTDLARQVMQVAP